MTDNEWLLEKNTLISLDHLYVFSEKVGRLINDGMDEEEARETARGYLGAAYD